MAEKKVCDLHDQNFIVGWYFVDGDPNQRPLCHICRVNLETTGIKLVRAVPPGERKIKVAIRDEKRADNIASKWSDY